jgi:hypothetical protein
MGTGGPFPGGKARPGRDAYHSPSSAEVVNEYELYLLSLQAPPWRVAGLLYVFKTSKGHVCLMFCHVGILIAGNKHREMYFKVNMFLRVVL